MRKTCLFRVNWRTTKPNKSGNKQEPTNYRPISLLPFRLQKKILKAIYFKPVRYPSFSLFRRAKMLSVYNLHIYELVKFIVRSASNNFSLESGMNNMFSSVPCHDYSTRFTAAGLRKNTRFNTNMMKRSINHRGTVILNYARTNGLLIDINNIRDCVAKKIANDFKLLLCNDQRYTNLLFD